MEAKDFQGKTPLRLGCERCYTEEKIRCIQLLLEHGADVDAIDNMGNNAILSLVQASNFPCVQLLVKHGAAVNGADDHGRTPLFYAVNNEDYQTTELLLQSGANPNQKDDDGFVPLHEAVCQESYRCVRLLLDNGADVNFPDARGNSPLHFSCIEGFHKMATVLLGYGAKRDLKNSFGETPLSLARRNNHEQCVALLRRPRSLKLEVGQIFSQVEDEETKKAKDLESCLSQIKGAGASSPLPPALKKDGVSRKPGKASRVDMPSPTPRSVAPSPTFADDIEVVKGMPRGSKSATPRHGSLPPQRPAAAGGSTPRKGSGATNKTSAGATPRAAPTGPPPGARAGAVGQPRAPTAPKRSSGSAAPARGHAPSRSQPQTRHGSIKATSSAPASTGVYSTLPRQRPKASPEAADLPEVEHMLPPDASRTSNKSAKRSSTFSNSGVSTPPQERKQKVNAITRFFRKLFK